MASAQVAFSTYSVTSRARSHKGNAPTLPKVRKARKPFLNLILATFKDTNDRCHQCHLCKAEFTRSDLLARHRKTCREAQVFQILFVAETELLVLEEDRASRVSDPRSNAISSGLVQDVVHKEKNAYTSILRHFTLHSDNATNIYNHDSLYPFPKANQHSMYAQHSTEPTTASSSSLDDCNLPPYVDFYRGFVDAEVGLKLPISDYYEPAGFLHNRMTPERWWSQFHSQLGLQFRWSELPSLSSADTFDICNLDSFWNLHSSPAVDLFRNDPQTLDRSSPREKALMYDRPMFRSIDDSQSPASYEQIQMGSSVSSELADQPFPLETRNLSLTDENKFIASVLPFVNIKPYPIWTLGAHFAFSRQGAPSSRYCLNTELNVASQWIKKLFTCLGRIRSIILAYDSIKPNKNSLRSPHSQCLSCHCSGVAVKGRVLHYLKRDHIWSGGPAGL
ncbi:hypothetical protein BDP27DRAFT_1357374 [Rhodocollybia butyracea]|uniref:Uncharacterized protein n=1 Tax=Rhodocollybia butyracea TaxID=206335 RepID=A0A9P5Q9C3_9AGAR|nr:hypothetical protein BDP27DRAFT_1357374 [Rhodocollybia butyracea]